MKTKQTQTRRTEMKTIDELLDTKRYCYWLIENEPSETDPNRFRVAFVFEGESDYYPSGGSDVAPWYWDEKTCKAMNRDKLALSPKDVAKIITSSMFALRSEQGIRPL